MVRLIRVDLSRVNPWPLFVILMISNALLAYSSFSYLVRGWIFFFGVFLPFFFLMLAPPYALGTEFPKKEKKSLQVPTALWVFGVSLAIYLRFFHLTDFHQWLTGDEGLHGFLAIPLSEKWNWQFFYTVGEHPPLLIWTLSFFFKFFQSPFFNIWFLPALFSALAVPMAYFAARTFFAPSFSQLFAGLWAFSFWPLYFGRYCHQSIFIPFLELTCIWLLGMVLKEEKKVLKNFWAAGLGLVTGLGSLTFTSWAVVVLLMGVTLFLIVLRNPRREIKAFSFFIAGLFLTSLPFLLAVFREGYGHHLIDSSAVSSWFSHTHQFITYLSYCTCLFWGNLQPGASYAPVWGGVLNPILAACFFLGAAEIIRHRKQTWAQWSLLGFFLCLLPAFLAADYVEFNRIIQVMPFLLLFSVVGFQSLSRRRTLGNKTVLLALLVTSCGLDLNHLLKIPLDGPVWKFQFKREVNDENFQAYQLLERMEKEKGPGLVFTDFLLLSHNHSLNVTAYHFNAAFNPRLDPGKASWAGLMVNIHYQPFLEKRFPGSQWNALPGSGKEDGGMVLGFLPVTDANRGTFDHWVEVHHYFHELSLEAENILNNKDRYGEAVRRLPEGYALVQGDPFLESCFGEWLAQYHYAPDYRTNISVLKRALDRGYPSALLFYKLGNFYLINGQPKEARQAFLMAARSKPNYTNAEVYLHYLDRSKAGINP